LVDVTANLFKVSKSGGWQNAKLIEWHGKLRELYLKESFGTVDLVKIF
jgi:hypothetical protein